MITSHIQRPLRRAALLTGLVTAAIGLGLVLPASGHASPASTAAQSGSTAPADTVHQAGFTRGFTIYNLSSKPMRLTGIAARSGVVDSAPAVGHILPPGQRERIEITFFFFADSNAYVHYDLLDNGYRVGTYNPVLSVLNGVGVPSSTASTTGPFTYTGNGTELSVQDATATTIEVPASRAQEQASLLKQLCQQTDQAKCAFTVTSRTQEWTPKHEIWRSLENNSAGLVTYTREMVDTTRITNSVGVDVTAGGSIAGVVNVELTARYGHEWTTEHTDRETLTINVEPRTSAVVSAVEPVYRDTGDFTVTMGKTTWQIKDVFFDSYDSSRVGRWIIDPLGADQAVNGQSATIPIKRQQ